MQKDINKLIRFLNHASCENKESEITGFSSVGEVYKWTNETFLIYPNNNLENKKVLTITGSGDHALDAILKGSKEIESIDINIFSKYVSALKIAMIKSYDFKRFLENYDCFTKTKISELSFLMKIIDTISIYLTPKEVLFWTTYAKYVNILKEESGTLENFLFIHDIHSLPKNNNWYTNENYEILKEKLNAVKIKYYDGDIKNVNKILDGNFYDNVYLSNILGRIDSGCEETDNAIRSELIIKILNLMNKNGVIYSYFFNYDDNIRRLFADQYNDVESRVSITFTQKKIIKNYRCFTDSVASFEKIK